MKNSEKRLSIAKKYSEIIGRNYYSQSLRDYCFKKYKDGKYYSDCSSSICYSYKEAGESFGITNTAGMYNSKKLTFVDVEIKNGIIVDRSKLRVGDMLLFAGNDSSRPKKIGHVEMIYSIGDSSITICGHGSGRPSYKDLDAYCRSRYNSITSGGWRKGLVCVKRYIQDNPEEVEKLSGWVKNDDDTWSFYLGNIGEPVKNSWYQDSDGKWYWFNGAGIMVANTWYQYNGDWYYLGSDGAMVKGQITIDGKWYILDGDGKMVTDPVVLTPDQDGALQYDGLGD